MRSKSLPSKPELPEFTSDRLRLLAPLITPRALELAHARILRPKERLVSENCNTGGEDPATVKVALMLVTFLNPEEDLTNEEEGLQRRAMKARADKTTAALVKLWRENPFHLFTHAEIRAIFNLGKESLAKLIALGDRDHFPAPMVAQKINPDHFKQWLWENRERIGKLL